LTPALAVFPTQAVEGIRRPRVSLQNFEFVQATPALNAKSASML
jgi:hypothetical protein